MEALRAWVAQLEFGPLLDVLVVAAAALICITFHELCHGLTAYALGDDTAKQMGRLTLNPIRHVDLFGLLMLVTVKVGWAKPVPIDARRFKNPRLGMAVTALAGPVSNVVLSALAAAVNSVCIFFYFHFELPVLDWLATFSYYVFYISIGLAVFNILPFPPLDGSKVLFSLLPQRWYWWILRYERYGMFVLMALTLTGMLDVPLNFLRYGLAELLVPVSDWVLELLTAMYS